MVKHVVVGRFQIFTKAHLEMIKKVAEQAGNGNLVIVLGSAQESGTPANPFSADEREAMIGPALKNAGIPATFRRINDVGNYPKWARKLVDDVIGTEDIIVYGGEDSSAVKACAGIGIQTVVLRYTCEGAIFPAKRLSAGYVATLICQNNPEWMEYVPEEIVKALMAGAGNKIKEVRGLNK